MKVYLKNIIKTLGKLYKITKTQLNYSLVHELVIAVMLSSQCTDIQVNKITPKLFKRCKTVKCFADISLKELEKLIFSTGFYHNKAKNIKALCKTILEKFNGEIPSSMEKLLILPGIGRKSANVILQEAFNIIVGIVVDTHCLRLSYRIGFTPKIKDPNKMETHLIKIIPKKYWHNYSHWCIYHGRKYCTAKKPRCYIDCPISNICPKNGVNN